jgi:GTP cyclohydrolase II
VWTSLHPLELSAQILKDLAISIRLLASSKRTYVGFGIEIVGTEPIEG